MYPLLLSPRPDAHVHVPPIPAKRLRRRSRNHRRVPPRLTLNRTARHQPAIRSRLRRNVQRRVHIRVYKLTRARELPVEQSYQRPAHRIVADRVICLVSPAAHRRNLMVIIAAAPHRPPERQRRQVAALIVPVRPLLSERRYRDHHQRRIDGAQLLVSQPQRPHIPDPLAIHYHVRRRRQILEYPPPPLALQVESDAPLAGVVVPEEQAPVPARLILVERLVAPRRVARRRLHLDYVRAHVRQRLPAPRPYLPADLQHPNIVQNAIPAVLHQITPSSVSAR